MKSLTAIVFLHIFGFLAISNGKVLELDERFLTAKSEGTWLVMFYAPWCGHCKSLEPTWIKIGKDMQWINPEVNVARVDATRHSSVAQQFGVQGFPTIKFFQGKKEFEYRGQRQEEDIIAFVARAQGPAVKELYDEKSVEIAREKHEVFFMYVGDKDHPIKSLYNDVADSLMTSLDFYSVLPSKLSKNLPMSSNPSVVVFKDGTYYEMPLSAETASHAMFKYWVISEQIPSFNELNAISYGKLRQVGKLFAIAIVTTDDNINLKTTMKNIALQRMDKFHEKFAFTWVKGTTIPNSLTYSTISNPNVLVFDSSNYGYYALFDEDENGSINEETIKHFLEEVMEGKIVAKGGSGFIQQVKRVIKDILNMLINMFRDSPLLGSFVIGLPTVLVSLFCYCICTIDDSNGESEYDSEEDEPISGDDNPPEYNEESQDEDGRRHSQAEDSQEEGSQHSQDEDESQHFHESGDDLRKRKTAKKVEEIENTDVNEKDETGKDK